MTAGQAVDELLERCDSVHLSRECEITLAIGRSGGVTVIGHGAATTDALEHLLAQTTGWRRLTGTLPIIDDTYGGGDAPAVQYVGRLDSDEAHRVAMSDG